MKIIIFMVLNHKIIKNYEIDPGFPGDSPRVGRFAVTTVLSAKGFADPTEPRGRQR